MMNPDNNYNSQLEKTQSQYQRKLARQRQLEAMEAAASGTAPSMQLDISSAPESGGLRSRGSETARRFLYDDDEDLDAAPRASTTAATSQAGIAARTLFERRDEEDPNALNLMDHETGVYREQMTFGEKLTNFFFGTSSISGVMPPEKDAIMTEDGYYSRRDDRRRVNCCVAACYELKNDKRKASLLFVLIAVILVAVLMITAGSNGSGGGEEINSGSTIVDPEVANGGTAVIPGGGNGDAVKINDDSGITTPGGTLTPPTGSGGGTVAGSIDEIRQKDDTGTSEGLFGKLKNKLGFADSEEKLRKEHSARFNSILDLLLHEGSTAMQSFLNYEGPEYMALRWISYADPANIDPAKNPDDIVKRYILAVFYYNSYITFQTKFGSQKPIGNLTNSQEQFIAVPNPGWTRKDYWLSEKGVCLWYGVTCELFEIDGKFLSRYDGNGNISQIELPNNNVYGYLPSEFKGLEHMTTMDFSQNYLSGTFPTKMGRLYKLEYLYLQHNEIGGNLTSDIGSLGSIKEFYMGNNKLTGSLPTEMSRLYQLQSLSVEYNQLTGKIPSFSMSKNLAKLYLSHNSFGGFFPFEMALLTNLKYMHLDNNAFTGTIPPELGNIQQLMSMHLEYNKLRGTIPPFLFKWMVSLQEMFLDNNAFTGTLPSTLDQLDDLHTFSVHHNNLSRGIPTTIGQMNAIQKFYIHNNALTSTIPTEVGQMSNLEDFWANENKLEGGIPTEFGNLRKLKTLYLEKNTLAKTVPSELANIQRLTTFRFYGNFIHDAVPKEICDFHDNPYTSLKFISADCGNTGKVTCDCCDKCY